MNSSTRIGIGFDVHAFDAGRTLVLGGVAIPGHPGLSGHSDADVVIHALADAILGALGHGDIGLHFPDSDEKWRNADSRIFLQAVSEIMNAAGFDLVNADIVVICETPKIQPHRQEMTGALAEILGVQSELINVKATTTERMGFTGRGEGIACQAAVLLAKPDLA